MNITKYNPGIVSCLHSILHQSDELIMNTAIRKMESWLRGRIMEPKISGKIASGMLRTVASLAPNKVLPLFLPRIVSVLQSSLGDVDHKSDKYLGDEIMFNMLLLTDLLLMQGDDLKQIFK